MQWNFKREEGFEIIPVGEHRVRITKAEKAISKSGNDMVTLELEVSGYKGKLWNYIVFNAERPEITNRQLTQIFDSFGIDEGNFNLNSWVGSVGGAMIKHETYQGEEKAKINYFINKAKQKNLPPWKDVNGSDRKPLVAEDISDEDIPF